MTRNSAYASSYMPALSSACTLSKVAKVLAARDINMHDRRGSSFSGVCGSVVVVSTKRKSLSAISSCRGKFRRRIRSGFGSTFIPVFTPSNLRQPSVQLWLGRILKRGRIRP